MVVKNCHTCTYKRKPYKRVSAYKAVFGCSKKKENRIRAYPAYDCEHYKLNRSKEDHDAKCDARDELIDRRFEY